MLDELPKTSLTKVNFRCDLKYKNKLAGKSCIIHISVGQPYHEGEKFIATMDLINETFDSCYIMLCDSLQRHSLRIKKPEFSEEEAYQEALLLGDEWLARNKVACAYLTIPSTIVRWDEWLAHKNYGRYRDAVNQFYQVDPSYQQAIHDTINKFLIRQGLLGNQRAFDLCEAYVLEECPVLVPLWAETKSEFIVYPRFRTPAMAATYNQFVGEHDGLLLEELALKFNRRVLPKKLSFSYLS